MLGKAVINTKTFRKFRKVLKILKFKSEKLFGKNIKIFEILRTYKGRENDTLKSSCTFNCMKIKTHEILLKVAKGHPSKCHIIFLNQRKQEIDNLTAKQRTGHYEGKNEKKKLIKLEKKHRRETPW